MAVAAGEIQRPTASFPVAVAKECEDESEQFICSRFGRKGFLDCQTTIALMWGGLED